MVANSPGNLQICFMIPLNIRTYSRLQPLSLVSHFGYQVLSFLLTLYYYVSRVSILKSKSLAVRNNLKYFAIHFDKGQWFYPWIFDLQLWVIVTIFQKFIICVHVQLTMISRTKFRGETYSFPYLIFDTIFSPLLR